MAPDDDDITRREFDLLARHIERIDQDGTRGFQGMQLQQQEIAKDVGKLEAGMSRLETSIQAIQVTLAASRPARGAWARDLALMLPMYALVIDLIVRHGATL